MITEYDMKDPEQFEAFRKRLVGKLVGKPSIPTLADMETKVVAALTDEEREAMENNKPSPTYYLQVVDEEGKPTELKPSVTLTYVANQRADLVDIWQAFLEGAREGQKYPNVNDEMLNRAADAYVKLVLERAGCYYNFNDNQRWTAANKNPPEFIGTTVPSK